MNDSILFLARDLEAIPHKRFETRLIVRKVGDPNGLTIHLRYHPFL